MNQALLPFLAAFQRAIPIQNRLQIAIGITNILSQPAKTPGTKAPVYPFQYEFIV